MGVSMSQSTHNEPLPFEPDADKVSSAMKQLEGDQKILDYDTKEFTVELLVHKFGNEDDSDIFVPNYQRRFNWGANRQSRFIESLLIGLPVPFLFFADLPDGRLEVVDGRQRLSTCKAFLSNELVLVDLERLDQLTGFRFRDLDKAQQRRFRNRTIRSVVVSQKASEEDRRDLFDRINTGSLIAEPAETRRGAFKGPMTDLVDTLAVDPLFQRLCPMPEAARRLRQTEELVVRFFTFSDGLEGYRDDYTKFLNKWLRQANARTQSDPSLVDLYKARFREVMEFVERYFPNGFTKKPKSTMTPRVRFDAIAIGTWKALEADPALAASGPHIPVVGWLSSEEFKLVTTSSAANVRSKIENRLEYVMNMLLGNEAEALKRVPGAETDEND